MRSSLLVLVLALAACGSSTTSLSSADLQQFSALASNVASAASSYGAQAAATSDLPSCASAQAGYDGQVRPMIAGMNGIGARMDVEMAGMGHMSDADMGCDLGAMKAALDRHQGVACSSPDVAANRAEAAQHVAEMTRWADLARARAQEMGSMMGMPGMGGMGAAGSGPHCAQIAGGGFAYVP
jgi:hypothetical protein